MKLSTVTWTADGVGGNARPARSWWVTTRSQLSSRLEIARFTTVTSPMPASLIFLRSTEAPIAEEPIPASQANTMLRIGLWAPPEA